MPLLPDPPSGLREGDAWLRVVNVTDMYKLDNFPQLATLLAEARQSVSGVGSGGAAGAVDGKCLAVHTGDFLAPYLLSSVDGGRSMVDMLNRVGMDVVLTGNHEDDVSFADFCRAVRDFSGQCWLSSNLTLNASEGDGLDDVRAKMPRTHTVAVGERRVGFVGVLSDTPSLYKANAFGGATISDPYAALRELSAQLYDAPDGGSEPPVDLVIPLQHLYVPQDHVTCREFDFPVVLSGHDHHTVDEVVSGTRLLKAGGDADKAVVLDLVFPRELPAGGGRDNAQNVRVSAQHVAVTDFASDPLLEGAVKRAYSVLDALKNTQLASPPATFRPLSSSGSRGRVCTMATYLWSALRDALNSEDTLNKGATSAESAGGAPAPVRATVDTVLICGGDLRGGADYPDEHEHLTLEDLRSEVQEELEAVIVQMKGSLIAAGLEGSHKRGPTPAFMQFDDGVSLDPETGKLLAIAGQPLDPDRVYSVASTLWAIGEGIPEWAAYFETHKDQMPEYDIPVLATLLQKFARQCWLSVWRMLDVNQDGQLDEDELKAIDTDGDGRVSEHEVAEAMRRAGFEVDKSEMSFVRCVMDVAGDTNHDGFLDKDELHVVAAPGAAAADSRKRAAADMLLEDNAEGGESHRPAKSARSETDDS